MAENAKQTRATVIPTMRYQDAAAAIAWLCGLRLRRTSGHAGRHRHHPHAQLSFGNGMIMLGSAGDDASASW